MLIENITVLYKTIYTLASKLGMWLHWFNGLEFELAQGDGEGEGSLACCIPQGRKELDITEQLNNNNLLGAFSPEVEY